MKFGRVAVTASEGVILAHAVKAPGIVLRKGEVMGPSHIAALEQAGIRSIIGARMEPRDIEENAAALMLAHHIAGDHVRLDRPFTGRCNLLADSAGLACVNPNAIDVANSVDEAITVATLPPFAPVMAGEMIATVKIIPFAVPIEQLERARAAQSRAVHVAPYRPLRVGVVSTLLPGLKRTTVDKTLDVLAARLAPADATIAQEIRVNHEAAPVAAALRDVSNTDLILVFGASAITDRRDVVPVAIELAGGEVEQLGMPVDPGNLLLLGHVPSEAAKVPLIGAPGCARSAKENGFDFVLRRFLAGLPVGGADLRRMGVGGLLNEITTRPQSRERDGD